MENKPFKALVVNVNSALESQGQDLIDGTTLLPKLALGELGIYNADSNLACDTALSDGAATATRVYFAVGVDTDGDGVVDDIVKSPVIKVGKSVTSWEQENYTAYTAQVLKLSWDLTKCATEYGLKIAFNGVNISNYLGFHQLYKTFATKTGCCTDCDANCNEDTYNCKNLADELVALINADPDQFVTAATTTSNDFANQTITVAAATGSVAVDFRPYSATGTANVTNLGSFPTGRAASLQQAIQSLITSAGYSGEVTVTEVSTDYVVSLTNTTLARFGVGAHATVAATANSASSTAASSSSPSAVDTCPGITLTVNTKTIADYCRVPVNFIEANGITMSVTGFSGFDCNFDVVETTAMVYAQGKGISIKALEEEATGFLEGALEYRYTSFMQPDPKANLTTNVTYNYDVFSFELVDEHSSTSSGADVYKAPSKLFICVKTGSTVTTNMATIAAAID